MENCLSRPGDFRRYPASNHALFCAPTFQADSFVTIGMVGLPLLVTLIDNSNTTLQLSIPCKKILGLTGAYFGAIFFCF